MPRAPFKYYKIYYLCLLGLKDAFTTNHIDFTDYLLFTRLSIHISLSIVVVNHEKYFPFPENTAYHNKQNENKIEKKAQHQCRGRKRVMN